MFFGFLYIFDFKVAFGETGMGLHLFEFEVHSLLGVVLFLNHLVHAGSFLKFFIHASF